MQSRNSLQKTQQDWKCCVLDRSFKQQLGCFQPMCVYMLGIKQRDSNASTNKSFFFYPFFCFVVLFWDIWTLHGVVSSQRHTVLQLEITGHIHYNIAQGQSLPLFSPSFVSFLLSLQISSHTHIYGNPYFTHTRTRKQNVEFYTLQKLLPFDSIRSSGEFWKTKTKNNTEVTLDPSVSFHQSKSYFVSPRVLFFRLSPVLLTYFLCFVFHHRFYSPPPTKVGLIAVRHSGALPFSLSSCWKTTDRALLWSCEAPAYSYC